MSDFVTELKVYTPDHTIFDTDMPYVIPLYQRAYAWGDKQIVQLIEDIKDIDEETNYYIGSLIVSRQNDKYEVVDGQQRLTTLIQLMNFIGLPVKNTLTFACREKSNYTLTNIRDVIDQNRSKLDYDRIEAGIERGIRIIKEEIHKADFDAESFKQKLAKVIVYRIEVPEHTDLNRYFEIMNTRGEQLEQHDILKATLMSYLPRDEQPAFAAIWDACSDMTGYVQMHFVSPNNTVREGIFGGGWNNLPTNQWDEYPKIITGAAGTKVGKQTIANIIREDFNVQTDDGQLKNEERVRFESVIEFPYFLLHVLRVLIADKKIVHVDGNTPIIAEQLDDKKLTDSFMNVIENGYMDDKTIADNHAVFARTFAVYLLRTRFLFDKYIIKREFKNDNTDGEWSLKSLHESGYKSQKKPYYKNTRFKQESEWETTNTYRTETNIMIQSALRVSYTSPKVMHWITILLQWLTENNCAHTADDVIVTFSNFAEDIAKKAVRENFFNECSEGQYAMGVNTPHIVFNYLDYLLWKDNRKKYSDFVFEFRNSVEHWYPQNPSEGTFETWKGDVDRFGNLCIIQRNVNSKFSNMSPEAKKSTFKEMIAKGSIKLRIMSDLTKAVGDETASACWKNKLFLEHEEEMIQMLHTACGITEE